MVWSESAVQQAVIFCCAMLHLCLQPADAIYIPAPGQLSKIILKHLVDQQPIMACDNSIKPIDFAKTAISRPSMKFKMRDVRKTLEATNNPREIDFSKLDDLQKRPEGHFDALEILLIIIDGLNIYNLVRVSVV